MMDKEEEVTNMIRSASSTTIAASTSSGTASTGEEGRCFPCNDEPPRSIFRLGGKHYIWAAKNGKVGSHKKYSQARKEQFVLVPVNNDKSGTECIIMHHRFRRYLAVDEIEKEADETNIVTKTTTASVSTVKEENLVEAQAKWNLKENVKTGSFTLTSLYNNQTLVCDDRGVVHTTSSPESDESDLDIYMTTGELCFISSPTHNKRLSCNVVGAIQTSENWKGREVWRLMEAGSGYVRISLWMNSKYEICCDDKGEVFARKLDDIIAHQRHRSSYDSEWAISPVYYRAAGDKAPQGVSIRSQKYRRFLCIDAADGSVRTISEEEALEKNNGNDDSLIWQTEAAHRQVYSLYSDSAEESVGIFPLLTRKARRASKWCLEHKHQQEGIVSFRCYDSDDTYLCCREDGGLELKKDALHDQSNLWIMEVTMDGNGYAFQSKNYGWYLVYEEENEEEEESEDDEEDEDEESEDDEEDEDDESDDDEEDKDDESDDEDEDSKSKEENVTSTRRKKKHLSCAKDISNTTRHIWLLHQCVPRAINHAKIKSIAYHSSASVVSSYALTFAVGGVLGLLGTAGVRMGVAVIKLIRLSVIGINDLGTVTTAATIASILVEKSDGAIDMQEQEENNSDNSFSKRPFCAWRSWS